MRFIVQLPTSLSPTSKQIENAKDTIRSYEATRCVQVVRAVLLIHDTRYIIYNVYMYVYKYATKNWLKYGTLSVLFIFSGRKFKSQIQVDGKQEYLGIFDTRQQVLVGMWNKYL